MRNFFCAAALVAALAAVPASAGGIHDGRMTVVDDGTAVTAVLIVVDDGDCGVIPLQTADAGDAPASAVDAAVDAQAFTAAVAACNFAGLPTFSARVALKGGEVAALEAVFSPFWGWNIVVERRGKDGFAVLPQARIMNLGPLGWVITTPPTN